MVAKDADLPQVLAQAEDGDSFVLQGDEYKFCKASNAPELFAKPNIDGGLIGGASLKAADFKGLQGPARRY